MEKPRWPEQRTIKKRVVQRELRAHIDDSHRSFSKEPTPPPLSLVYILPEVGKEPYESIGGGLGQDWCLLLAQTSEFVLPQK